MFTVLNKLYVLNEAKFLHVPENTFFDIHLILFPFFWHKASCTLLCKQCSIQLTNVIIKIGM